MLIEKIGKATIVEVAAYVAAGYPPCTEFYVYVGQSLKQVCPSIGMARSVAAAWSN
jgi:hypothetical protein